MTRHQWSRKGNPPSLNIKLRLLELSSVSENRSLGENELLIMDQRNIASFGSWTKFLFHEVKETLGWTIWSWIVNDIHQLISSVLHFASVSAFLDSKKHQQKNHKIKIIVSLFITAFFVDHYDCRFIQIICCAWVQINSYFTFKLCRFCQKGF